MRGDRAQLQKGRIELGRTLQAWSPIKRGGGTWVAPTHLLQDAKERGPRARTTLYPSWATCGWAPPKSLRDFGSNGTLPQEAGCSPVPFPQLRLAAPGASVGPSCALPSSWPPLSPQTLGRTNSDPLDDPELPLAGEVDFRGELGGRFPVRSFNLISPFPSKSIPSPFPEKAGTRWCDSKEWLVEVENDGGTQSPNLV